MHQSADVVAFSSTATNLVAGDTNAVSDVFEKDLGSGAISRLSVNSSGVQGNGSSGSPVVGPSVTVFLSDATNLVDGDTNGVGDGFLRAPTASLTLRVTNTGFDGGGESADASISDAGRYVAFSSNSENLVAGDTNNSVDIFLLDLNGLSMSRISVTDGEGQSNGNSFSPSVSADGRYVAFGSIATNLVTGDTNGVQDVFVRDHLGGSTRRVSVSTAGVQGNGISYDPQISADGRYVVFASAASTLVAGDTNGFADVFIRDLLTSQTTRISVNGSGQQGNGSSGLPAITDDGNLVVFSSNATNLVGGDTNGSADIFVKNRTTGVVEKGIAIWFLLAYSLQGCP
jgi:Tol biopolymer transport system component